MAWPIRGSGPGPYPTYKDSGVSWLGEVPGVWQVSRLKRICRFVYGDSLPTETRQEGNVPVFGSNGCVGFHTAANTHAPCIVIGRKGSFGKVNFSQVPVFAIDTTYFVDDRYTHADLRWLSYLLVSLKLDGISKDSAVPGLAREDAYAQHAAYPASIDEQVAIVRYLDHADRKVRHAIRARQQLIKLLTEQKQAIIQRAVTRGLDPNVRLKPSGVPWLGDVPEHWEIMPLKRVSRVQGGYAFSSSLFDDHGVPIVRMTNLKSGRLELAGAPCIPESECVDRFSARVGDLLYGLSGSIGNFGVVQDKDLPVQINQRVGRFVPLLSRISSSYLALVVQTPEFSRQVLDMCTGTAQLNVSPLDVERVVITVPSLPEQTAILAYVHDATAILDKAIDAARREIDLLREYRIRLIADVVTGKLDVRDVPVPDDETDVLPEDVETIDDVDAADQGDDATEENSDSSSEERA